MILAIDIGNSRIKTGLRTNDHIVTMTTETHPLRETGEYLAELELARPVNGVIISSVVEELNGTFGELSRIICKAEALFLDAGTDTGIRMEIDSPAQVGSDRIANAVGGYHLSRGPAIIIDMGSATTITVVSKDAEFIGGCIMPGIGMMALSLHEKTSKLPEVAFDVPDHVIGKDTVENITAGLSYGTAGALERLVAEIKKEIGYTMNVILTGGMSPHFKDLIPGVDVIEPFLTMHGLFVIYERNRR